MTTHIQVGSVWKEIDQPSVRVAGVWEDCVSIHIRVAGVWKEVWAAVAGDVIDLQDMIGSAEGDGSASCTLQCYGQSHSREGEQWYDDGPWTYQNDVITPKSNTDNYQMKWDALSGDAPDDFSTPEGVWESLDLDHFYVAWEAEDANESVGSVTVSIREGTGSVLDTATWDGEAVSHKKGK